MNPIELAQTRYATKRYDPQKTISEDHLEQLKEVLRLTPSSINCQPWKFIFVRDRQVKSRLAAASLHNEHKINDADLLIVFHVIDDLNEYQKWVDSEMDPHMAETYNAVRPQMLDEQVKNWLTHQVYIAMGFCLSSCIAMGLDSTPMEGIEPEKYREILQTGTYRPIFAIAVGYRHESDKYSPDKSPKSRRSLDDVVISI